MSSHCKTDQNTYYLSHAWMVELVDTLDSKSGFSNEVGVRVPLQAVHMSIKLRHTKKSGQIVRIFYFLIYIDLSKIYIYNINSTKKTHYEKPNN